MLKRSSFFRQLSGAVGAALLLCATTAAEPVEVQVDLTERAQTLEGWGTSLAWWANGVGDWEEENLDRLIEAIVDPETGLGLNVFRYNIGGGENPDHHHMRRHGHIPGYLAEEGGSYEWTADARQVRVLKKLADAADGAILEAFSNSPPWWMTRSGCVSGAEDGGVNFKREYEAAFASYLVDVVEHLTREEGLMFQTLEPMNEPNANWWNAGGSQEGCHIPQDQQARLIQLVGERLQEAGLPTTVSASDANTLEAGLSNLRSYTPETLRYLGQFNVHSYFGDSRTELRELAAERGLRLWQSETGPLNVRGRGLNVALTMAERIVEDLNELQPVVWNIWQVLDSSPTWRYLEVDWRAEQISPHLNGQVLRQFTRFIRPGFEVVPTGRDHLLMAISDERKQVVVVLVNRDEESRHYEVELIGTPELSETPRGFRTSATETMVPVDGVELEDTTLSVELPAESITTVVMGW